MFHSRLFNLDNPFIKLFARCANIFIYVNPQPAMLDPKPATYTGNWFRQLLSNTSQAGWRLRIALRHRGIRWWLLTEGYNYTQCSQGNLLFFHYKCQEDKDLQEREGRFFAVSFSEKSSLPLPK